MKRLLLPAVITPALLLAACASEGPRPPSGGPSRPVEVAPNDAGGFAWSTEGGSAGLSGKVGYRTKLSAYTCAGGSVALTPDAPASADRTLKLYGSRDHAVETLAQVRARSAGEAPPAYGDYVRSAKCGEDGRFAFSDLPAGAWYLIARAHPLRGKAEEMVIMRRVVTGGPGVQVLDLR